MSKVPILSWAPVMGLYLGTYAAEKVHLSDDFVEYDFSPVSMKLVKKMYDDFLKPLDTDFIP